MIGWRHCHMVEMWKLGDVGVLSVRRKCLCGVREESVGRDCNSLMTGCNLPGTVPCGDLQVDVMTYDTCAG
jgi:hypothetical protein